MKQAQLRQIDGQAFFCTVWQKNFARQDDFQNRHEHQVRQFYAVDKYPRRSMGVSQQHDLRPGEADDAQGDEAIKAEKINVAKADIEKKKQAIIDEDQPHVHAGVQA